MCKLYFHLVDVVPQERETLHDVKKETLFIVVIYLLKTMNYYVKIFFDEIK